MSEPWHLRKELSVGTLLSLATLGFGSVWAFAEIKADVHAIQSQPKVEVSQVARIEERLASTQKDVEEIKRRTASLPAIEEAIKNLSRELQNERDTRREERRNE